MVKKEPVYHIRFVRSPGARCAACGARDTGVGTVAYRDDEAICDACALGASTELGLVLALIAVIRIYATKSASTGEDCLEALRDLGAFTRVYELVAAKTGPPRTFHFPPAAGKAAAEG